MLELFSRYGEMKPAEYAELARVRPLCAAYAYLWRHHRNSLLRRKRDRRGRLVYRIASNGAKYLLWWKQTFPDAKVLP